jgi:hypothetical protein
VPGRLLNEGFVFQFPEFRSAIAELESRLVPRPNEGTDSMDYARALRAVVKS